MWREGGGATPFLANGRLQVGKGAASALKESLLFHLTFHRFSEVGLSWSSSVCYFYSEATSCRLSRSHSESNVQVQSEFGRPRGYDRARGEEVHAPLHDAPSWPFEEVFTSSHWLVRIYRVRY